MSFYATIQGNITYPTVDRLKQVVDDLTQKGWMRYSKFVDELGNAILNTLDPDYSVQGNLQTNELIPSLTIPLGYYRNLARELGEMAKDTKGTVVWSSTDGCFAGGIITDGVETTYDLTEWAKENMEPDEQVAPDMDKDFENWYEWAQGVEQEFHCEFV